MGQLQFPVSWYFDEALYQKELEVLFKNGPGYLGHELMVPEVGCYRALEQFDEGMALVRDRDGVHLLSNICRHRQAIGTGANERLDDHVTPTLRPRKGDLQDRDRPIAVDDHAGQTVGLAMHQAHPALARQCRITCAPSNGLRHLATEKRVIHRLIRIETPDARPNARSE